MRRRRRPFESDARGYVVSLLGMLADTAQHTPDASFGSLVAEHQTKGGLNERVRATLLEQGWFDVPRRPARDDDAELQETGLAHAPR